jgi:glyoxylase-like metal-dependent hydrolase (beta-lactamase superfamily II)
MFFRQYELGCQSLNRYRSDLLASAGVSAEHLAGQLYHSLHEQLLTLPDSTLVFPAHGAGSACGRAMSSAPSSTIGAQLALTTPWRR